MRKIRVRIVSVLLLLSLLLTGCGGNAKNYVHTDTGLKKKAEKALEEKYGEEFVIHDVWTMSQTMFYATCSPEDEQDIVFEAKVYKDGRGVYSDEYIQGAVAKQIEEKLRKKLDKVFENYYLKVTFTFVGQEFDYYEDITIEEYYGLYEDVTFYLRIFVAEEDLQYSKDIALNEYEVIADMFSEEIMQDAGCSCFFVSKDVLDRSKKYFMSDSKGRGEYSDIIKGNIEFGFGFNDGVINKTFEEYDEVRKEINANE